MSTLRGAWIILKKDLIIEFRTREVVATMMLFALLLVVVFFVAFSSDVNVLVATAEGEEMSTVFSRLVGPGIIWVTVIFAGTLGVNRVFDRERQNGCLQGLFLSPAGPTSVFLAKVMGLALFMFVTELIAVPAAFMFLGLEIAAGEIGLLVMSLVLGTLGFAFMGTLFGAMFASVRLREVLLPVVVYPLITPLVVAGIELTGIAMGIGVAEERWEWIRLMVGFNLVFMVLPSWLFSRVMTE